jgi:hypothetical protein
MSVRFNAHSIQLLSNVTRSASSMGSEPFFRRGSAKWKAAHEKGIRPRPVFPEPGSEHFSSKAVVNCELAFEKVV